MNKAKRNHVYDAEKGVTYIDTTPPAATVADVLERAHFEGERVNGIWQYQWIANGEQKDLMVWYTVGSVEGKDTYMLRYTDIEDGVLVAYVNDFGVAKKDCILYTGESVIAHVLGNSMVGWQKDFVPHEIEQETA